MPRPWNPGSTPTGPRCQCSSARSAWAQWAQKTWARVGIPDGGRSAPHELVRRRVAHEGADAPARGGHARGGDHAVAGERRHLRCRQQSEERRELSVEPGQPVEWVVAVDGHRGGGVGQGARRHRRRRPVLVLRAGRVPRSRARPHHGHNVSTLSPLEGRAADRRTPGRWRRRGVIGRRSRVTSGDATGATAMRGRQRGDGDGARPWLLLPSAPL